jgi:hypothetical protein
MCLNTALWCKETVERKLLRIVIPVLDARRGSHWMESWVAVESVRILWQRIPQCLDNRLIDAGKLSSPRTSRAILSRNIIFVNVSGTHFC